MPRSNPDSSCGLSGDSDPNPLRFHMYFSGIIRCIYQKNCDGNVFTKSHNMHELCRLVYVVARFHFCLQNGTDFAVTGFVKSRACVIDARWENDGLYFVYKITKCARLMSIGVRSSPISLLFTKLNRICSNRFCQISNLCYRCPLGERWFIFCLQNHKMCGYKRRPVHVVARFHFC